VWAALDCPSWHGAARGRPALLGPVTGCRYRALRAGEPVIVTGWGVRHDGRKTVAGSASHTLGGEAVAAASSIWIHPEGA
jgi:hypothetical protein